MGESESKPPEAKAPPIEERKEPGPSADAATERGDERFLLPADLPVT